MRYIIFTRVSTNRQDTANQFFECKKYVESVRKPTDDVVHIDEGANTSRKKISERPLFQNLLQDLKKGDTLVVYKINRMARNHEIATIWHDLEKKGVKIVSLYESSLDGVIIHAYAMVGAAELRNIQQNTKTALRRRKEIGHRYGACPYGITVDKNILQTNKPEAKSFGKPYILIEEENEGAQVKIMLDMFKKGCTYGQISAHLTEKGYRNRKGNPIHRSTVYRVLKRLIPTLE
jgi:DNA invertase Pin-like site-specific DNA recombinase